jgi:hypothetical protein
MLAEDTFAFVFASSNSRFNFSIALQWSRLRCCCCCCPRGCCCCCCCRWVLFPYPACRGFPVFWLLPRLLGGTCLAPEVCRPSFLQEVLPEVLPEVEVWMISSLLATSGRGSTCPGWQRTCATCRGKRPCRQYASRGNPAPLPPRESRRIPRPCTAWGMEGACPASPLSPCSVPPSWPFLNLQWPPA